MNAHFSGFIEYVLSSPLFYIWVLLLQILLCTRKRVFIGVLLPSIFIIHSFVVGFYFMAIQSFSQEEATLDDLTIRLFLFSFIPGVLLLAVFFIFNIFYRKGLSSNKK